MVMSASILENKLRLEEWDVGSIHRIEATHDTLSLCNLSGKDIDERELADDLARIAGIEAVKSVVVEPSSRVTSLLFLKAFPAAERLRLNGLRLRSLDGLERFGSGRFLEIDTGRNTRRDIGDLAATPITRLVLRWANPGDLEAIERSATLRELLLSSCPELPLRRWRAVPLETMSLFGGVVSELTDTGQIPSLRKVTLDDCRKLERFAGDNGHVTWMVVQHCNRIDWPTIAAFVALEHLWVVGVKNELPLSAFVRLERLRSLSLQRCKVQIDVMDLKSSARSLEKLLITGLKKAEVAELSKANRGLLVSNGTVSYRDGAPS
jgi:hypothetical protein